MSQDYYDNDASVSEIAQVAPRAVVREQSTYMTDQDAQKVCTLFGDGLSAGIGYARILDFMERQKLDKKMIQRMRYSVLELGDRLGEAFARFGILDGPTRKLILVAEEQGTLPRTFKEQAKFYGKRYKRRKKGVSAMVYPVIIACLGLFYFVPNIKHIKQVTLAHDTWQILRQMGIHSTIISAIFCVVCWFLGYAFLNMPVDSGIRAFFGRLWYAIPFFSKGSHLQSVANFCRYLEQSINAGMDVYRSLDLAAEASGNPAFIKYAPRAARLLEEGYPLDAAFREIKEMPEDVLDYVGIGEQSGRIDEQLRFLTTHYDELAEEASEKALLYFTNIVIFAVIIGTLIAAFTSVISIFKIF